MVHKLIHWAVDNPLIVLLLVVALIGVGGYSFVHVNVEAYPDPAPAITLCPSCIVFTVIENLRPPAAIWHTRLARPTRGVSARSDHTRPQGCGWAEGHSLQAR